MHIKNTWLVIINPNAGKSLGRKHWTEIAALLEKEELQYRHTFTNKRHDAIYLAKSGIESGW